MPATALTALLAATGCGAEGPPPPDGGGPRPALVREDTVPPAPEPDAGWTEPSPREGLTRPSPPPAPEPAPEPAPSPPPPAPAPRAPAAEEPDGPGAAPTAPPLPRPGDCAVGDETWDDFLRQMCERYLPGGGPTG
ncbi:hypothetical protein CAG99_24590 [Streptomyces marincola]|uniref:Uncharacterized protein n=1 Tax=Streptomyces marincola TaxID=2878388 RepID=A0A1W7D3D2_9ACTN|nr:hypothetical protein CAG99_24590 [Streptomyces marincola]